MEQEISSNLSNTVRKGLHDEMEAAFNYINQSANQSDITLKKAFLNYAAEELGHAQKLLNMLDIMQESPDQTSLQVFQDDDLISNLVEYIANEESAIFYYDVLHKLHSDEQVKCLCQQIQQEEKRHLNHITDILAKIKSGDYHYD